MASKEYSDQSISSLKGADRVRKRPAVIFGSDGLEGCEHSFFEILSNSIDEAREGYGKEITVTVYRDRTIEVDDRGRGVPLDYNQKEGKFNWELVYCELYAGGKYDNNNEKSAYQYSLGLNGLGACATQYSSEFMDVYSYKGDLMYEIHFEKGNPVSKLKTTALEGKDRRTGTLTRWRPDLEVFTDTNIPKEHYLNVLHKQAIVNAGLKLVLKYQNTSGGFEKTEFLYKNGISDYIGEITNNVSLTAPVLWSMSSKGRDRQDKKEYKLKAEIAFCVSNKNALLEYYHNSSFLEHGGSPDKAVKRAFRGVLDKYLKDNGKYARNESITFEDIEDCLVLVINSFSTETSYENQTKKSITNKFIEDSLCDFMKEKLEIYFLENRAEAEIFANQVLTNMKARRSAENTRLDLKNKLSTSNDFANRVEKFVPCRSKDPEVRELYIVEGDSALSSCKGGRDPNIQALIPVRGKTLNCLKSTYDKIFKSDIILDLLKVVGCGVEVKGIKSKDNMATFDMNNLKWRRIIICTDADEDGFQIRTLILTMFYRLLPTLIKEGRVFIAESPLYEITTSKDKIYFAYNEAEKAEILAKLEGEKYTVQRSKGLGENDKEMMWETTMNPESRRLIQVMPTDEEETRVMFETLLGDDIQARKDFIAEYGYKYMNLADI
ncbi:MAG: DNA topoisomerase [Clostridia bacterium]|nr:DNA topoisomerase [Clostridia bacterium]